MEKIAFISDIHGNIEALNAAFDEFDKIGITRIVCLGDVVSYNANQINCIEAITSRKNTVWIAGNHDLIAADLLEPVNCSPKALYASMKARSLLSHKWKEYIRALPLTYEDRNNNIFAFHASLERVDEYLSTENKILNTIKLLEKEKNSAKYIFFGHTHKSIIYKYNGTQLVSEQTNKVNTSSAYTYLVNVGTLGEPRTEKKNLEYCVFNVDEKYIENISKEYPFTISFTKSIKAKTRVHNNLVFYIAKIRHFLSRVRRKLIKLNNDDSRLLEIVSRRNK